MKQLEIHNRITEFFKAGPAAGEKSVAQGLLINTDSKRFFFSTADDSWLDWLWNQGFLDALKAPSEDYTKLGYHLSELEYLTRMAEKNPAKITEIILHKDVATTESKLNIEVVDRFLWIISTLPAEYIKQVTHKILEQRWFFLMRTFSISAYELEKMINRLSEAKENDALLELAQAMLEVKSKTEVSEKERSFGIDSPFYIKDMDASEVFGALANIEESHLEEALRIASTAMGKLIELGPLDDSKVFAYDDLYVLYDVDFYVLEVVSGNSFSPRDDIKNLAATVKKLAERAIRNQCENPEAVSGLFARYIDSIPSSRAMWRLKLFALSQCPEIFKTEITSAFFKIFEVGERYFEIECPDYYQAISQCFGVLDRDTIQRQYVQNVFTYFGANLEDQDMQKWRKRDGVKILALLKGYLTTEEKNEAKALFGTSPDETDYTPEPSPERIRGGTVHHISPVQLEGFTIEKIVEGLKNEWTPPKLQEQFKDDDFLNPRGVEGLGDALKEDIKKRTDEYLNLIKSFFDRNNIHSHYLYSLLRGIEELTRNKQAFSPDQTSKIFSLFEVIEKEGRENPFEKRDDSSWLADWVEVHKVIADILLFVLENRETREETHRTHREEIVRLISYLLTIKHSPTPEHEKPEYGEPYHVAINSVRGRAYEAFVVFTGNDEQGLAEDIKEIFIETLKDDSLAVRFVVGRYLAVFYFRDKEFITPLLPEIFPKDDSGKKDIYLASWEGYLSNTLYDQLFKAFESYYKHAITLEPEYYTERKYSKGLDESLAIHLALAFAHLGLQMTDELFIEFWAKKNIARHKEFISFIGRSCLTRDQAGEEWLKANKVDKEKLIEFWERSLVEVTEPEVLAGFGFWVNPNKEVLDDTVVVEKLAQTLAKSDGGIDWDYGLLRRLTTFAEKNGEKTLEIISSFLLNSEGELNQSRRAPLLYEHEIKEAMSIIYKNGDASLKQKVVELVDNLVLKGSSTFWSLKEVIK